MSELAQNILHRQRSRWLFPAVIGAVGVVIASLVWQYRFRFPFDDVFITFRYADHLASGHGLVWNIGGPHTEGYTNFLFALLLAVVRLLTSDLLSASQMIGLFFTIVTGIVLYKIGSNVRDTYTGLLASTFYLLTPLTWINALSGMETSLFVMFIAVAILFAIKNRFYYAFGAAFLATLTRPEGALLGFILLLAIFVQRQQNEHRTLKGTATAFVFAFLLPLIIYAVWKYLYFGALLPNSFYVKVLSSSDTLFPGLQYVRLFIVSMLMLFILSFGIRGWREKNALLIIFWIVALLTFYLFVLPLEGLYDRYLWAAFAMLCIVAAIGLHDLAQRLHFRSVSIGGVLGLAAQICISLLSPRTQQALSAHEEVWDASMDRIVGELRSLPHFDSLRLAYGDAGYVVYRSGIQHIDIFGLNDTRIAHARSVDEKASILRSEKPDIMLLPVYSRDTGQWVEDAYGLARTSSFESVASTEAFPYTLVWLLNKQSPYYLDCRDEITRQIKNKANYLLPPPTMR
jgi:arabinofuranosyltransferase